MGMELWAALRKAYRTRKPLTQRSTNADARSLKGMPTKAAVVQVPTKGPKSFINTIGFLVGKQRAAQKHLGFARCAAATDMIFFP